MRPSGKPDIENIYRDLLTVSHGPYIDQMPPEGFVKGLKRYLAAFRYIARTLWDGLRYGSRSFIGGSGKGPSRWLFIASPNNFHALNFLSGRLEHSGFVGLFKKTLSLGHFPRVNLSRQALFWYRAPWIIGKLWPTYGRRLLQRPDTLLKALGSYEAARKILSREMPECIVFANDHIPEMRAFLWAARELGVRTIYIQHASVSTFFPPLRFGLSLLEGEDSLEKYKACGRVDGVVKLIGMPRFDHFVRWRKPKGPIHRIALCGNVIDDPQRTMAALATLHQHFQDREIFYRPHPRDERALSIPSGVSISDPGKEGIFEFLRGKDILIAGDTSTHLEAALLNIPSVYFPLHDHRRDYYGYVASGLIESAYSLEELLDRLENQIAHPEDVYLRARPYNALVGTKEEGMSQHLALKFIEEYLNRSA